MNEPDNSALSKPMSPATTRRIGRILFIMGAAIIFAACKNLEPLEAVLLAVAAAWLVIGTWMTTTAKILSEREQAASTSD